MKKFSIMLMIAVSLAAAVFFTGSNGINAAKIEGYKALKVFVQFRDNEIATSDFMEYETDHFILKYREEDENIVRETANMFEKSYTASEQDFGYQPGDKTVVIIYKNQEELWSYQKSVQGQAVMGVYSMGTIHILSPNAYTDKGPDKMKFFETKGPVLHEYTHRIVDDLTGGNIELWLTEGIALYQEYKVYGTEWAPGFTYERYFNSYEMREDFMNIDETQSYRQSYDMVKYLIDNYGIEDFKLLMQELKSGMKLDDAFLKVYGVTADEFIDSQIYAADMRNV